MAPAETDAMATVDTVHEQLCDLLAGMMGSATGHAPPRPHASFLALGATEAQAAELTGMVNALFGLDLPRRRADALPHAGRPGAHARHRVVRRRRHDRRPGRADPTIADAE